MTMEIFIGTLSPHQQFDSIDKAETALESLIKCFDLVDPGLAKGTVALIYDGQIEQRALLRGNAALAACLHAVPRRDLRLRWYLYTRNRAKLASVDFAEFELQGGDENLVGNVSIDVKDAKVLAGFGGSPACQAEKVRLRSFDNEHFLECQSVFEYQGLAALLPRYERNPKHRQEPYIRSGGERVAPMSVSDADAQVALLEAIEDGHGHRFAVSNGKILKFVKTEGLVFHAYEVMEEDVPNVVARKIFEIGL